MILKKRYNTKNVWQFLSKFKLNYIWKMPGYPQFSFRIVIALAKMCFFPHSHKPRNNIVVFGGKFLKKPEYPKMRRTYAQ